MDRSTRDRDRDTHRERRRSRSVSRSRSARRSTSPDRRKDRRDSRDGDRDRGRGRESHRRSERSVTPPSQSRHRSRDDDRTTSRRSRRPATSSDSEGDTSRRESKRAKKVKKARETSAERAARKAERRLEKAQLKEDLKAQKESQLAAQMSASLGYSNTENPFGDSNLSSKFLWLKKREKETKQGLSMSQRVKRDVDRREEIDEELEKLKKRRNEREIEMQLREQEAARLQREQDRIAMGDWEAKENEFHLQQAKTRAQIRIKEERAKPIDVLAINLSLAGDSKIATEFDAMGLEMGVEEPYLIFRNLVKDEVEELHKDIQLYLSLETEETNKQFWEAMIVVCDDELAKHRAASNDTSARPGVNQSVAQDIEKMFANKTLEQLDLLQKQIDKKLGSGGPIDIEYWETAIRALIVWKAKAKLRDMHAFLLKKRLARLREQQKEQREGSAPMEAPVVMQQIQFRRDAPSGEDDTNPVPVPTTADYSSESETEAEIYTPAMSPRLSTHPPKSKDQSIPTLTEDQALALLLSTRAKISRALAESQPTVLLNQNRLALAKSSSLENAAEQAFIREAAENMGLDEDAFNEEAVVISASSQETYLWHDKYRPRKPRYFNRVHTGYEWNKYNQTHYDGDNPPPKVVQGYKFNIFYPDLLDKQVAPTYVREKDAGFPDTIILRFKAGPPYEDIAFRIVNREWEFSHKKGFRSSYDRGVLQLWFHFKRHYYRR
ncbi:mid region of cactin-domain-containing protein [Powellomyces hirtus]|nr:mid region of cactin-domain-containing protein [Powellomyces hirtus]